MSTARRSLAPFPVDPPRLERRQIFRLGAGAVLGGALSVGPARLVAQQRDPWFVFVSEHRADLGYIVEDSRQGQFASTYTALGGSTVAGPARRRRALG